MSAAYDFRSIEQAQFAAADARFATLKRQLVTPEFCTMSHAALERHLHTEGVALMRELLQATVTLAGQGVPSAPVIGADGVERTHVRHGATRQLETIFGTVTVEHDSHSARGHSAIQPVDAALNLPRERYSLEVRRQVAHTVADVSFDRTGETLAMHTGAHVPKRQLEQITVAAARDFDPFYATRNAAPLADQPGPLLIMSFDHKGVVMHPQDLREATIRQAARGRSDKLESRYSRGQPHGRKRMATVAAVYTTEHHVRTSCDVIASLRRVDTTPSRGRPRPQCKRVWASLTKAPIEVIDAAFAEAQLRDPYFRKHWFVLIDGSPDLERWVREVARRRGVQIVILLDFIHVMEWLSRAVYAFHPEGSREAEAWVLERMQRILEGEVATVAAGIGRSATRRGIAGAKRRVVDQCRHYLHAHKHKMTYKEHLAFGTPIGTGVVEGACRHVINDRMDITGARWRLDSAEAILRLRAIFASGDFDEYWQFHETAEWRRNHAAKYADFVPKIARSRERRHLRLISPPS